MSFDLRPEPGIGEPVEIKRQRVCDWSKQRTLRGVSDIEFEHVRLSQICKCEAGEKNSRWEKRCRHSGGVQKMEFCWRPCRIEL